MGEHIRKKRLDLGLTQLEVAKIIGVKESTVWNWEHGREPELKHMPKIIEFLGFVPFKCPEDPIGKLRYFKLVNPAPRLYLALLKKSVIYGSLF
ncbi:MAG: helix-turn-helix transcriptional regulator [Nitrospirae bacterium]|nr:helix-turn-helix transcriptional regulator [Nitrospirota bacterium]